MKVTKKILVTLALTTCLTNYSISQASEINNQPMPKEEYVENTSNAETGQYIFNTKNWLHSSVIERLEVGSNTTIRIEYK